MTLEELKYSLSQANPPAQLNKILQSLWWDAKGDWDKAHTIAQDIHSKEGSLIHAYLHRQEGDLPNASYWYHQADAEIPTGTLKEEWEELVKRFLS